MEWLLGGLLGRLGEQDVLRRQEFNTLDIGSSHDDLLRVVEEEPCGLIHDRLFGLPIQAEPRLRIRRLASVDQSGDFSAQVNGFFTSYVLRG